MTRPALALALLLSAVACTPIARDAACDAAEACDQALEEPFGDFAATDPVFGDDLDGDGTTGDAAANIADSGTCWQNGDTAVACIDQCNAFIAEQLALATEQGNQAVIAACGG